ncbi:MAG: dienelactone hydrolase family protein [Myxococcota bacterium]
MCDDITESENELYLKRRTLGLGAAATLVAGCKTSAVPEPAGAVGAVAPSGTTMSRSVTVTTPDGEAEGFFVAPSQGKHPAVLIWPDVAGLRPAFEAMATRLAEAGYAVLAVNQYYRSSTLPIFERFDEWMTDEGKAKTKPMFGDLSSEGIAADGAAFVAWLDQQAEVDTAKRIGTTGYCMGGPFTVRTAAAAPERVGLVGSFHGGGLVTDAPDSPHALFSTMQAAALICVAQNDDARAPETKATLKSAADAAGRASEIEVYPAQHGWCVPDSPVYDEPQAERAWTRLLANLEQHL